jgi:hypothetical protein
MSFTKGAYIVAHPPFPGTGPNAPKRYGASPVRRRRRSSAELAALDEAIVAAVAEDRPVTLRGVFYRVVSAGAVEKTELGYEAVGRQLLKLRRSGAVSYADITDGTRFTIHPTRYADAQDALDDLAASYRRMLWRDQPVAVQIFSEKDAITGAISSVTDEWDVPLGIVRGYSSETFAHSVAESILDSGKGTVYLYQLGDHDPSGVDAWRAFCERVEAFVEERAYEYNEVGGRYRWAPLVVFERLAVTPEQIDELDLPTRPTKKTDARAGRFRGESVEVDAIPARVLRAIVREAIEQHIDVRARNLHRIAERNEREGLRALAGEWAQ